MLPVVCSYECSLGAQGRLVDRNESGFHLSGGSDHRFSLNLSIFLPWRSHQHPIFSPAISSSNINVFGVTSNQNQTCGPRCVNLKKMHNVRVVSLVLFGATRDCSLGDPTAALRSFSKESGGKGQHICDFSEGGIHWIQDVFSQKLSAGLMKL